MMEKILKEFKNMRAEFQENLNQSDYDPFAKDTSSVNSGRLSTVHTSKSTPGTQGKTTQPSSPQGQWQNKLHFSDDYMKDFPMIKYERPQVVKRPNQSWDVAIINGVPYSPQETPAQTKNIVNASMEAEGIEFKDTDIINCRRLINPRKENKHKSSYPCTTLF
eukprot:g56317.t1